MAKRHTGAARGSPAEAPEATAGGGEQPTAPEAEAPTAEVDAEAEAPAEREQLDADRAELDAAREQLDTDRAQFDQDLEEARKELGDATATVNEKREQLEAERAELDRAEKDRPEAEHLTRHELRSRGRVRSMFGRGKNGPKRSGKTVRCRVVDGQAKDCHGLWVMPGLTGEFAVEQVPHKYLVPLK